MDRKEFIRIFETWSKLAKNGGKTVDQIFVDMKHSSLLWRMIEEGKEPLPYVPPRAHGYPWYEICDGPEPHPASEIHFIPERPLLTIAQHVWEVLARISEDEYLITTPHEDNHAPVWVLHTKDCTIRLREPMSWIKV